MTQSLRRAGAEDGERLPPPLLPAAVLPEGISSKRASMASTSTRGSTLRLYMYMYMYIYVVCVCVGSKRWVPIYIRAYEDDRAPLQIGEEYGRGRQQGARQH